MNVTQALLVLIIIQSIPPYDELLNAIIQGIDLQLSERSTRKEGDKQRQEVSTMCISFMH